MPAQAEAFQAVGGGLEVPEVDAVVMEAGVEAMGADAAGREAHPEALEVDLALRAEAKAGLQEGMVVRAAVVDLPRAVETKERMN